MFDSMKSQTIHLLKREDVTRGWKNLNNKELHCSTPH